METIKLSQRNFWFKYWNFISFCPPKYERPTDTCSLKRDLIWKTLFAMLALPTFIVFLLIRKTSDFAENVFEDSIVFLLMGLLQFFGFIMLGGAFGAPLALSYVMGPTLLMILIAIIGVTIVGIITMVESYRENHPKPYKVHKPSIITVLYRGWKEKLCSKIEYID